MSEQRAEPISLKCKICGGDIVNDYLAGACVCAHCGNKWSLEDLIPDYGKYSSVITKIKRASDFLTGDVKVAETEQARLLYQTAISECENMSDAISSDLLTKCREGLARAEEMKTYLRAKTFLSRKSYNEALAELEKIPSFKDSAELIEECRAGIEREKKMRIPWSIAIGMILPLILCIFLKEKFGLPLAADIPIFLFLSAGLAFLNYKGGVLSTIIKVLSFLCAVPLIIFMVLAYVFHVDIIPSVIISIVLPIGLILSMVAISERKE